MILPLSDMVLARVVPNTVSYNSLISACGTGFQWELALHVLGDMRAPKDRLSFSSAITACEKVGRWVIALSLLVQLSILQRPDAIAYNSAVSVCENAGQWKQAGQLLVCMRASRVMPTVVTYSAVISACAKAQQWQWALHWLTCACPTTWSTPTSSASTAPSRPLFLGFSRLRADTTTTVPFLLVCFPSILYPHRPGKKNPK